jgi:hypothetical protein
MVVHCTLYRPDGIAQFRLEKYANELQIAKLQMNVFKDLIADICFASLS